MRTPTKEGAYLRYQRRFQPKHEEQHILLDWEERMKIFSVWFTRQLVALYRLSYFLLFVLVFSLLGALIALSYGSVRNYLLGCAAFPGGVALVLVGYPIVGLLILGGGVLLVFSSLQMWMKEEMPETIYPGFGGCAIPEETNCEIREPVLP